MSVLFIGVYRDGTGWGQSSINHILALDSVGVNVVPRSISLSAPKNVELPNRILELEQGDITKCDYCIQQVLPEYYVYSGRFKKNIGLLATETRNITGKRWVDCCNLMDEIWVHNEESKKCLKYGDENGRSISGPIFVHDQPTNVDVNLTDKLDLPCDANAFKFYFVGEPVPRKGIRQLLQAFHSEFRYNEPVSLVVKLSGGSDAEQWFEQIALDVKKSLCIYPEPQHYRKELLTTEYLSDIDLQKLHNSCDCMVVPSHGEAWSIPAADAICHNKPVVLTDSVGVVGTARNACYVVESQPEYQCIDDYNVFGFTGSELWSSVDVTKLRLQMRLAYENKEEYNLKVKACENIKQKFTYEAVGKSLKESLYA